MTDDVGPTRWGDELLEESLEDLYEHAPCGYLSTLPNGTFAKVNQTLLDWTGYQRDELLGRRRFQDVLTVGGKIFYETHFAPLLRMQGFVNEIAFDLVCCDTRHLPVLVSAVQICDSSGVPIFTRITVFNASERRQYERELQLARKKAEQALQLRDQFLSLASHELRTPLTSLLGNIQLLQRRALRENSLSTRDQRTLQVIVDQAQRLNRMVLSLLDISRIETGQLSIVRQSMDVCALVERVVGELQLMLHERDIYLTLPSRAVILEADELRLEQVLHNLIQNALKYSQPPQPVAVEVSEQDGQVCIVVQDKGIGIPASAFPWLFERFFRASNAEQRHISGLGVGLFVVKEIVELHGGTVTVESTEGEGSIFTVCLPLDATA